MRRDDRTTTKWDLYDRLHQHRRPMVWTFSCVMLVTIAVTFLTHKTYQSEAKLFVRVGHESVSLDPTATTGQVFMINESRENEINSIFELMRSREILANVVEALGPQTVLETGAEEEPVQTASMLQTVNLFGPYSQVDEAIRRLGTQLKIAAVKKSNVINVSYEAKSPERARDIVASVIEQARDAHVRVNRIQGSHAFFSDEADQLREKLTRLETQRLELKNAVGVSSLEDQRLLKLKEISELQTTWLTAKAALSASNAELKSHHAALRGLPETIHSGETTGMPHSTVATMREQLFGLRVHEKEILSKYREPHPLAVQIREQVTALQAIVDREPIQPQVEQRVNTVHQEMNLSRMKVEAAAASLEAQAKTLGEQLVDTRRELTTLNNCEVDLARLDREIDLEAANYKKYSENLEQARIDHLLQSKDICNLNVLQPPSYSVTPVRPRRMTNLAVGLFTALVSSLGVGLFLEQRRGGWPLPPTRVRRQLPQKKPTRNGSDDRKWTPSELSNESSVEAHEEEGAMP